MYWGGRGLCSSRSHFIGRKRAPLCIQGVAGEGTLYFPGIFAQTAFLKFGLVGKKESAKQDVGGKGHVSPSWTEDALRLSKGGRSGPGRVFPAEMPRELQGDGAARAWLFLKACYQPSGGGGGVLQVLQLIRKTQPKAGLHCLQRAQPPDWHLRL